MNMKELLNAVRWAKNNPGALMKAMGDGRQDGNCGESQKQKTDPQQQRTDPVRQAASVLNGQSPEGQSV